MFHIYEILTKHLYYVCVYTYIYIYIYRYIERECYIYIYMYIYTLNIRSCIKGQLHSIFKYTFMNNIVLCLLHE